MHEMPNTLETICMRSNTLGGGGGGGGRGALMPYANIEGPDQHAHPCSLIMVFSVRRHIQQYPLIL